MNIAQKAIKARHKRCKAVKGMCCGLQIKVSSFPSAYIIFFKKWTNPGLFLCCRLFNSVDS